MRSWVYFFVLALLIASDLLCILIQFNPGGILSMVLEYPAQGEEAANRNLWKVLFLVLPTLQLLACFLTVLTLNIFNKHFANRAFAKAFTIASMISVFVVLSADAYIADRSDFKSVLFHTLALSIYLSAFMLLGKFGKKFFPVLNGLHRHPRLQSGSHLEK